MAQYVRDIMTSVPVSVPPRTSVTAVAQLMRDQNVGAVLVADDQALRGVVSDRDLVVRAVADGGDLAQVSVLSVCSAAPVSVGPDEELDRAVGLMREHSIRRLPVVEDGRPVGVVSLGDLAIEKDPRSALGDISSSPSNR